jgi:hypothetical protein
VNRPPLPSPARRFTTAAACALSAVVLAAGALPGSAARLARVAPPPFFVSRLRTSRTTAELTAGYRLTREVTLRGGYYGDRGYTRTAWDNQAGVSLVWARRWY